MATSHKRGASFIREILIAAGTACFLTGCKPDAPAPAAAAPSGPAARAAAVAAPPAPKAKAKKDLAIELPGRSVSASVPEPGSIQGENGAVMIVSGEHRITIGVRRVMADGVEMMQIPEETKNLKISLSETGLLTVNREDAPPAEFQLPPPGTEEK